MVSEVEANLGGTVAHAGVWHYTADFHHLVDVDATGAPARRGGNTGFYLAAERQVTAPHGDGRGLSLFGRVGVAQAEINQFKSYAGAGMSYTGLLGARPDDVLGLAVAHARNGRPFRQAQTLAGAPVEKAETNFELTYRAQITDWLALQPDAQWVINPGTDPGLKNAFVIGLRFEIGFGKGF